MVTSEILMSISPNEDTRVATIENGRLTDLDVENCGYEPKKANIYLGIVSRVEPSLGACFVNYGAERQGFLPFKEIDKKYFAKTGGDAPTNETEQNIQNLIMVGQVLIVQVDKEERGNKGAALTTFISIAGSYLVLMPNNPKAGGISRRIEGDDRDDLKNVLDQLKVPEGMGVIVRTSGAGRVLEELQWDLETLLNYWNVIKKATEENKAPCLIHKESDIVIRTVRDYLRPNVQEIFVDNEDVYKRLSAHIAKVRPDFVEKVHLYNDQVSLFTKYQIEQQIEAAYQRKVNLPSGGEIVIDKTEALISIDVNSSKSTSGKNIEETALATNLEAADEIARQLRIRDIGGLLVIDFIDMLSLQNQKAVTNRLREALQADKARVRVGNITKFGLLEMSRQRIRPPLDDAVLITCPRCGGQGTIRTIHSLASTILRLIDDSLSLKKTYQLECQLPVDLATYLANEKRNDIIALEKKYEKRVLIIPNPNFKTPTYRLKPLKAGDATPLKMSSYKLVEGYKIDNIPETEELAQHTDVAGTAVVSPMIPEKPAPLVKKSVSSTVAKKLNNVWRNFFKLFKKKAPHDNNYGNQNKYRNNNYRGRRYYSNDRRQNQNNSNKNK